MLVIMIDSPAEEDKFMWDYCTPGPEALHKEVTMTMLLMMMMKMMMMMSPWCTMMHHDEVTMMMIVIVIDDQILELLA